MGKHWEIEWEKQVTEWGIDWKIKRGLDREIEWVEVEMGNIVRK